MNKSSINKILGFELKIQTRTKSFWIISLIPPIAIVLMFVVNFNSKKSDSILVVNQSGIPEPISKTTYMDVRYIDYGSIDEKEWHKRHDADALVILSKTVNNVVLCDIYEKNILIPQNEQAIITDLKQKLIEKELGFDSAETEKLLNDKIRIQKHITNDNAAISALSMGAVFLLYLVILQFASSILRMTGREKKNKICEILLSSMYSADIMAGKLIAGLLAAFLQIALWAAIGMTVLLLMAEIPLSFIDKDVISAMLSVFGTIPQTQLFFIGVLFIFMLMGGFLLYSILFSIIGAVSNENTNTQQFSLIVTMPLLLTFMYVAKNFHANTFLMKFLSLFPLSSPIAAMASYANENSIVLSALSIGILFITIGFAFYYSCILYEKGSMSGSSKITAKVLFKWLRYGENRNKLK